MFMHVLHKYGNTYLRMAEMPMYKGFHVLNTYLNTYLTPT